MESGPDGGSTFWFTLPLGKGAIGEPPAFKAPPELDNMRVLVADRSKTIREVPRNYLGCWNMRPDECACGPDFVSEVKRAAAAGEPYRVLFIEEPLLRRSNSEYASDIKAEIAASGASLVPYGRGVLDQHTLKEIGAAATLRKPLRKSRLLECLVSLVGATAGARVPKKADALAGMASDDGPGKSCRILVAEDNAINRTVVMAQLRKLGYAAEAVINGREAVEAVETGDYDLILMDCLMPEMGGFEATSEIRRREAAGDPMPIIAQTAYAMAGDREKCLKAGMSDYLSKPVSQQDLATMLSRWTSNGSRKQAEGGSGCRTSHTHSAKR